MRDENQLHATIVEIVVHDRAEVKYSTVQNWYPGDAEYRGGVYNFVTKRTIVKGWTVNCLGHKWKQVLPLPGSIRLASFPATIRQRSSIVWQ